MPTELHCNQTVLHSVEMTIECVHVCVVWGMRVGGVTAPFALHINEHCPLCLPLGSLS